jgi:transcriptional regulator with XRE-family HTH domain
MKSPKKQSSERIIYPELAPLAKRLKYLRLKAGFSKERFAGKIEISRSLYDSYESGANITMLNLRKIIKGLGLTHKEFFSEGFD